MAHDGHLRECVSHPYKSAVDDGDEFPDPTDYPMDTQLSSYPLSPLATGLTASLATRIAVWRQSVLEEAEASRGKVTASELVE